MNITFEQELAKLNETFFFREFTFSQATFRPNPQDEVELSDHILWIDDIFVVYQLKERNLDSRGTAVSEERWYERKVLGKGMKQMRSTLEYLSRNETIELSNHRGDSLKLTPSKLRVLHKVICFRSTTELPLAYRLKKYHVSRTAGIIHLFEASDYMTVVQTLLTPSEFVDYLAFREELIEKWGARVDAVSEKAILGQYLVGSSDTQPANDFLFYLETLRHEIDEWDVSNIIHLFPQRMTFPQYSTDYYKIIAEIAKLKRNELREFKKRFVMSIANCRSSKFTQPYRFYSPRIGCGFLFLPLETSMIPQRQQGLQNLTYGCKYDFKATKCIGVSFAPDGDEWYTVEWCYIESPWAFEEEVEIMLKESNPFRETTVTELSRYSYSGD